MQCNSCYVINNLSFLMEPQDNVDADKIAKELLASDQEDEVHILDSKTNQFTVMKLKENDCVRQKSMIKREQNINENITVVIKNWSNDHNMAKLETFFFQVSLSRKIQGNQKKWEISRKYSDFEWLYNALKYSYPGCILPYMPVKNIELFMLTKLGLKGSQEVKQEQISLKKSELEKFVNRICSHEILKQAEETNIFLTYSKDQFQKSKIAIEAQIYEAKTSQSSTNGIVSIFERGMAWITSNNNPTSVKLQDFEGWSETQMDMRIWIKQFSQILEKIRNMKVIKTQEIQWQGQDTQIDAIQDFKAKIISSRQYNQLFLEDLDNKIIKDIEYQTKWVKQLENQLEQRQNIVGIINYIFKFTSDTNRCNKLIRKKQKFEANMIRDWQQTKIELKDKIRNVQIKFNEIWKSYCQKMHKIWKLK